MLANVSDKPTALVLAVALDDMTLGRIKAELRGTELTVEPVEHEGAVQRAQTAEGPVIALLAWGEEHEEQQARLCAALRRATRPGQCHIVALGGLSDPALARAMDGPVNDILTRPFGAEVLLRLRQALRAMQAAQAAVTPRCALEEALKSASGGEVAVRSGDVVGYIHVQNGFIVWANLSSVPATMEEVARHADVELDPEIIAAAKEECRATRVHFMDVLVAWNVIEAERAKEAVRKFVAERVKLVLELPSAVALFLPKVRPHSGHLRFSVGDMAVPHAPVRSVTPFPPSRELPKLPLGAISAQFKEAGQIDGAVSVAILDRKTSEILLQSGVEIDAGIAWSQLGLLAALGPQADDVIGSAGAYCFVTRPLQLAPGLALFVVLEQAATTIGLARMMIARITSPSLAR